MKKSKLILLSLSLAIMLAQGCSNETGEEYCVKSGCTEEETIEHKAATKRRAMFFGKREALDWSRRFHDNFLFDKAIDELL